MKGKGKFKVGKDNEKERYVYKVGQDNEREG